MTGTVELSSEPVFFSNVDSTYAPSKAKCRGASGWNRALSVSKSILSEATFVLGACLRSTNLNDISYASSKISWTPNAIYWVHPITESVLLQSKRLDELSTFVLHSEEQNNRLSRSIDYAKQILFYLAANSQIVPSTSIGDDGEAGLLINNSDLFVDIEISDDVISYLIRDKTRGSVDDIFVEGCVTDPSALETLRANLVLASYKNV